MAEGTEAGAAWTATVLGGKEGGGGWELELGWSGSVGRGFGGGGEGVEVLGCGRAGLGAGGTVGCVRLGRDKGGGWVPWACAAWLGAGVVGERADAAMA